MPSPRPQALYDPVREKDSCGVGFVAHVKGEPSHRIVRDAREILANLGHRGACGCEPNTGDGAGILTALPHRFLEREVRSHLAHPLPAPGRYGAGLIFLPTLEEERQRCKRTVETVVAREGQRVLGWRPVPTDARGADIGPSARAGEPVMEQLFVGAAEGVPEAVFERQLYLIRKQASHRLRGASLEQARMFYICSLSARVLVYKGQLTATQLMSYFPDLTDENFESHLAMVHSRFSTNTFPSWDRAQPNRWMCHNGEINTVRGNTNWMRARQGTVKSPLFGSQLPRLFPVVEPDCSDSGNFDNVLEFLLLAGRSLPEVVMMMIPEAWQNDEQMSPEKRAFYEYHSCLMEPWDGPASIVFTDGRCIGSVLDRNGLRPSRYYLTRDDRVVMASEAGVLPVEPANIRYKGRVQPGRMLLVDFERGEVIDDDQLKLQIASRRPYRRWLRRQQIELSDLKAVEPPAELDAGSLVPLLQTFGYTSESFQFMLIPLVTEKRDPIGSMGNDSALACLSDQPRLVYDYFKQLFAQVTNPPIDSIREEVIMSLECNVGPEGNLLESEESHAHRLRLPHPILSNSEMAALKTMEHRGWRTRVIDMTWPGSEGVEGMGGALDRICAEAEQAVETHCSLIVLSDRRVGPQRVPISSLLACGAVHHHLVKKGLRTRIGLLVESGEAREVHHHCLLVGYGADGINPYLVFEALAQAGREGWLPAEHHREPMVAAYRKGVAKGMLKVMAKMGISTLQSYKGAQIFEALGLSQAVIERAFAGTPSRIQGVDLEILAREALRRHAIGYGAPASRLSQLHNPGEFHWRSGGEKHAWSPAVIVDLQAAARTGDRESYRRFARAANEEARIGCTLRGLLRFRDQSLQNPISLERVEPASRIVKRFCTGAMSFGSISAEVHETLAVAMNRLGGKSNTGEGGEDPERFYPLPNGDSRRSAIKQVASGRFGVTTWYLSNADELQIKIAQGAKPGEGGELPGHKVDATIARIRYSTPGVGLISPPPHHDIYSIEDLKQLIHDLKNANPAARISVKLVAEVGVGTVAAGVVKAHADHILISGDSGGTGASPLTSIKHAGLPWELGLAETHQTLVLNDLRSRVVLQTDGGLKTGRDVVMAALLGAEEFGFSTAPLVSLGCIMMRKCHLNTCPVGIATQDPELRRRFAGQPEYLVNYLFLVAEEVRTHMARLGFCSLEEMIGRADVLETDRALRHWKADGLDLQPILTPARRPHAGVAVRCIRPQDHGLDQALDNELIRRCRPALESAEAVRIEAPVRNIHRAVGTMLSGVISRQHGEQGLPEGRVHIRLRGSAGQSLGAWLVKGVTLELEGDANDYVGKGLSGGRLILYPPAESSFCAQENIIVGNVVLYGATSGEAYFRGRAAERFAVRNSGARAVVEGVGDHGCEYMTGGRIVILGPTGRNFAAGMSGGIAYVWDKEKTFQRRCNLETVALEALETDQDVDELRRLIESHFRFTGSPVAEELLHGWPRLLPQFVKVMPTDYRRFLQEEDRETRSTAA